MFYVLFVAKNCSGLIKIVYIITSMYGAKTVVKKLMLKKSQRAETK